jgi:hypothetical protein
MRLQQKKAKPIRSNPGLPDGMFTYIPTIPIAVFLEGIERNFLYILWTSCIFAIWNFE